MHDVNVLTFNLDFKIVRDVPMEEGCNCRQSQRQRLSHLNLLNSLPRWLFASVDLKEKEEFNLFFQIFAFASSMDVPEKREYNLFFM